MVEATKYPISIVIVTVGSENISKIRKLDGDGNDLVNSNNNERAQRDIVQFVPFRKFKYDYKGFARELLAEIAKNIKDYFVDRKIYPNPKKTKNFNPQGRKRFLIPDEELKDGLEKEFY